MVGVISLFAIIYISIEMTDSDSIFIRVKEWKRRKQFLDDLKEGKI